MSALAITTRPVAVLPVEINLKTTDFKINPSGITRIYEYTPPPPPPPINVLATALMTTFAQPKTKLRMITAEDKMNKLSKDKRSSSWLSALPLEKHGFHNLFKFSIRIRSIPKAIRRCSMVTIQNGGIIARFCHSCLGNFAHCNDNIFCWNNPALSFYSSTVQ